MLKISRDGPGCWVRLTGEEPRSCGSSSLFPAHPLTSTWANHGTEEAQAQGRLLFLDGPVPRLGQHVTLSWPSRVGIVNELRLFPAFRPWLLRWFVAWLNVLFQSYHAAGTTCDDAIAIPISTVGSHRAQLPRDDAHRLIKLYHSRSIATIYPAFEW